MKITKFFMLSILFFFLNACASDSKIDTLRLSYTKTNPNAPTIVSMKKSIVSNKFAGQGISVEYDRVNTGSQHIAGLVSRELDIAPTVGGTSALIGIANGAPVKIVSMFGRSPKAFRIISLDPTITSISALKGKKIGGPKSTVLYQLLLAALKSEGISIDDIEFISMNVPDALTTMIKKDIDVALLTGPAALTAEGQGAHVITTGEGFIDGSTVTLVHEDFIKKHPDIIKKYLEAHQESVDFTVKNPEETVQLVSEDTGLTSKQVQSLIPMYDFNPTITQEDKDNLIKTQTFLREEGLISKEIPIDQIIYLP